MNVLDTQRKTFRFTGGKLAAKSSPFVKVGRLSRLREQDLDAWVRLDLDP